MSQCDRYRGLSSKLTRTLNDQPDHRYQTDIKLLRTGAKVCCVPIMVLLVIAALGPEKWAPRTELGWQVDHIVGYFGITLFVCFAWPRPFVVGGVLAAVAALLEGLQAFTPDRVPYLPAAFYGAGGALAAALVAELFVRVWRWRRKSGVAVL